MKTIEFKRKLAEAVKQKISRSLKGKMRGGKSLGTKLSKIPNEAMGEMQMINTTGTSSMYPSRRGAAPMSNKGKAMVDRMAADGMTGYITQGKAAKLGRQGKYMADTKNFLKGK